MTIYAQVFNAVFKLRFFNTAFSVCVLFLFIAEVLGYRVEVTCTQTIPRNTVILLKL